jgi:hypothetical protein
VNLRLICPGLLFAALVSATSLASAEDGRLIHGTGYEGIIVTPGMVRSEFGQVDGGIFSSMWMPSPELVREAEARLPAAITEQTPPPKIVAAYYVPRYFSPKQGTPHATPGNERLEDNITDSVEDDNFLYDAGPNLKEYKRQYAGVTIKGHKFILMQFINPWVLADDEGKKEYLHGWEAVLDGGDLVWEVKYDPTTKTFSDWLE